MTDISKADIYRRAAEIIVRDGKHETTFVEGWAPFDDGRDYPWEIGIEALNQRIRDTSLPVCALGACLRAEWELTGEIDWHNDHQSSGMYPSVYSKYSFPVRGKQEIWAYNDNCGTTAEDIALALKQHAEEIDDA